MNNSMSVRVFMICVMTSLGACGGGGASEGGSEETAGGEASSEYEGAVTSTDVAGGQELFENMCGDCHPDGQEDVGPSLIEDPHSPAAMRQQVREGSGKMRPFSEKRLSAEGLESVLAYLASIDAVK